MRSALQGLSYLHANQQLHRDIKSANILLSPDGCVQLADFGVAAALDAHDQRRTTFVGTVCYMAPEVLDPSETGGYDVKADSWSLGITAIELAYGKPPYALNQPMKVIMLLMKHPSPSLEVPEHDAKTLALKPGRTFSGAFKHFVDLCLQKDPRKRPTAQQLLEHSFFKNLPADEAVCSAYLVKNVLAGLPSVGDRYRIHAAKSRHGSIVSNPSTSSANPSSPQQQTPNTAIPSSSSQQQSNHQTSVSSAGSASAYTTSSNSSTNAAAGNSTSSSASHNASSSSSATQHAAEEDEDWDFGDDHSSSSNAKLKITEEKEVDF